MLALSLLGVHPSLVETNSDIVRNRILRHNVCKYIVCMYYEHCSDLGNFVPTCCIDPLRLQVYSYTGARFSLS